MSDADGIATVTSWKLGTAAGNNSLSATATGLTGSPVSFTATGVSASPAQVAVSGGNYSGEYIAFALPADATRGTNQAQP